MSESKAKTEIMLGIGALPGVRVFNNPVGSAWQGNLISHTRDRLILAHPRRITYGLAPGSADLIGYRTVTITPDMVGQRVAVFTALEVKAPGGTHRVTQEQRHFLDVVKAAGGIAGIARSPEQALLALGLHATEASP